MIAGDAAQTPLIELTPEQVEGLTCKQVDELPPARRAGLMPIPKYEQEIRRLEARIEALEAMMAPPGVADVEEAHARIQGAEYWGPSARRVAMLEVDAAALVRFARGDLHLIRCIQNRLPEDARTIDVMARGLMVREIYIIVESEEFELVKVGQLMPVLPAPVYRDVLEWEQLFGSAKSP